MDSKDGKPLWHVFGVQFWRRCFRSCEKAGQILAPVREPPPLWGCRLYPVAPNEGARPVHGLQKPDRRAPRETTPACTYTTKELLISKRNRPRGHTSRKGAARRRRTRQTSPPATRGPRRQLTRYERWVLSKCRSPRIRKFYGLSGVVAVYVVPWVAHRFTETAGDRLWRWGVGLTICVVKLTLHICK